MQVRIGQKVQYHPIIDGPTDGRVYEVLGLGNLYGLPIAWLEGKRGCVSLDSLTPLRKKPCAEESSSTRWTLETLSSILKRN